MRARATWTPGKSSTTSPGPSACPVCLSDNRSLVVHRAARPQARAVGADVLHHQVGAAQLEPHVVAADPPPRLVGQPLAEHHAAFGGAPHHHRVVVGRPRSAAGRCPRRARTGPRRAVAARRRAAARRAAGRSARPCRSVGGGCPPGRTDPRGAVPAAVARSGQRHIRDSSFWPIGDGSAAAAGRPPRRPAPPAPARRRRAPARAAGPAGRATGSGRAGGRSAERLSTGRPSRSATSSTRSPGSCEHLDQAVVGPAAHDHPLVGGEVRVGEQRPGRDHVDRHALLLDLPAERVDHDAQAQQARRAAAVEVGVAGHLGRGRPPPGPAPGRC